MKFDDLFTLIAESNMVNAETYSQRLRNYYREVFSVPSSALRVHQKDFAPPSHMHAYMSASVDIKYNEHRYKIYHKVYFLKIPEASMKSADNMEKWSDMMGQLKTSKRIPLTDELLNAPHIQVKHDITIYDVTDESKDDLGHYIVYKGTEDIVKGVKGVIDHDIAVKNAREGLAPTA